MQKMTTRRKIVDAGAVRGNRNDKNFVALAVCSARTNAENRAGVGDFIRIRGRDLDFQLDDSRCGVFFVDGSVARSPEYELVSKDLVVARVPHGLSAGPYLLRLRRAGDEGGYHELGSSSVFIVE